MAATVFTVLLLNLFEFDVQLLDQVFNQCVLVPEAQKDAGPQQGVRKMPPVISPEPCLLNVVDQLLDAIENP